MAEYKNEDSAGVIAFWSYFNNLNSFRNNKSMRITSRERFKDYFKSTKTIWENC